VQELYHMLMQEAQGKPNKNCWWEVLYMLCSVGLKLDDLFKIWENNKDSGS
jgi:hypothetical protein